MRKQLAILALVATAVWIFTGCSVTHYQAGDHKFTRGEIGVNAKLRELIVVVKKDGTRIIILRGLEQNQSESAGSISNGVASALTKAIIP